ncbi:replication factor C subunit 3 [Gossypium hirsutum]|uniref:Replication factor C subunit 3 n=2 Tax=Gossypium TaxID=3633 RepID=A0ABM3A9M1_GOSHI|nr:replication factor C subunit 3-like [Gossypium hirsutum]
MPSPATIPRRSSSDPDLTVTTSKPKTLIVTPPSSRSSASVSRGKKSSYWISWSNISKLGDFIDRQKKESDLTEESLHEHNKLHGIYSHKFRLNNFIGDEEVDEKYNKCSPYYKGLTDSTLRINREKNVSGADSPGRESQTTTVFSTSSSSLSILFGKVQELGSSCFTCTRTGDYYKDPDVLKPVKATNPSLPVPCSNTTSMKDIKPEIKEAEDNPLDVQLVFKEKPLRERVREPSAAPPTVTKTVVEKKEAEVNQKFILADKYRPKALKDFICNRSEALRVQDLVKSGEFSHIIFEGPAGVGKRTMIRAVIREIFGSDRVQTTDECKPYYLKGESVRRMDVNIRESSKHVEVNLSDLKGYEKHVIVELMKETQPKKPFSYDPQNYKGNTITPTPYTAKSYTSIVLCEADKLSTDALLYIRWLLLRYKAGNKVFFCCSDISKLQPIRSLCTVIKLLPPSKQEIVEVVEFIAKKEGIVLPPKFGERIANSSKNNLRQAIRSFEACWQSSYPFKEDQIILTGWEEDIANIAKNMVEERSPKQLYIIRGKLQIFIEHDVSPDFIFMSLVGEVKKHLHENLHPQVDALYDEYNRDDENMIESEDEMGTKVIDPVKKNSRIFSRIEEFIARFMSWYNNQSKMANAAVNTPLTADEGTSP